MEIKGRLVKVLPVQTGQGKNGEWKKQEFVIELEGTYPRKVCISAWGDKVDVASLVEGTMLNVSFDIESREYNGKWYTNLTAWKVEAAGESQAPPPVPPIDAYQPDVDPPMKDDLPF
ncbi:MAG: DUF3127 domain-containing protein [Bacteroidales bacterium]|jgi:hypothetical protein|nr:DUF3127 domain-containing protein [Bacteroidales bacterium]